MRAITGGACPNPQIRTSHRKVRKSVRLGPPLFDLVTVPDGLDSVLPPFWIPASAGMTVVRRSASAGNTMALPGHMRSMKMAAAFGESEDAGGDARAPSLGPRLRGDDGWCAGMTLPVWKAAPGAIFIAMTDGDPCSSSSNGYSTRCTELRTDRSTTLEPQQTLFSWAEFMAEEPVEAKRKPKPPTASPRRVVPVPDDFDNISAASPLDSRLRGNDGCVFGAVTSKFTCLPCSNGNGSSVSSRVLRNYTKYLLTYGDLPHLLDSGLRRNDECASLGTHCILIPVLRSFLKVGRVRSI